MDRNALLVLALMLVVLLILGPIIWGAIRRSKNPDAPTRPDEQDREDRPQ